MMWVLKSAERSACSDAFPCLDVWYNSADSVRAPACHACSLQALDFATTALPGRNRRNTAPHARMPLLHPRMPLLHPYSERLSQAERTACSDFCLGKGKCAKCDPLHNVYKICWSRFDGLPSWRFCCPYSLSCSLVWESATLLQLTSRAASKGGPSRIRI